MRSTVRNAVKALFLLLLVLSLYGCGGPGEDCIVLNDSFSWMLTTAESTVEDVASSAAGFSPLTDIGNRNLEAVAGGDGAYLWLRAEFTIPEQLKDMDLGLVIPYLHYADKVWINGHFSGEYGQFPPEQQSPMYLSHYYPLSEEHLDRDGTNTILIKVWAEGRAEMSGNIMITECEEARSISTARSFYNSRIYMIFEGGMSAVVMLYLFIYLTGHKEKTSRSYAMINFFTLIFMTNFISYEMQWYTKLGVSYLTFTKLTYCIPVCIILYFTTTFILDFLKYEKHRKFVNGYKHTLLVTSACAIIVMPDYSSLRSICPFVLVCCALQLFLDFVVFLECILSVNRETKRNAVTLGAAFIPFWAGAFADILLRGVFEVHALPFMVIYGWQGTMIWFMLILALRYNRTMKRNEYLNSNLKIEVDEKTRRLMEANSELAEAKKRSDAELDTAFVIQGKFLAPRNPALKGWNLSVAYMPKSKVSGDFYDYYTDGSDLKGMCIFDVSGHGIGASLITMIAKNTISRVFTQMDRPDIPVSLIMTSINRMIINAKGDVENYITGLLFKFGDVNPDGSCSITFANAGHPQPLLYKASTGTVTRLTHAPGQKQFGAIGINGIDVSFPVISFDMAEGDVLLCYTDGITEAMDKFKNQFGRERLEELLVRNSGKVAADIKLSIMDELDDFAGSKGCDDDVTFMVLKCSPSSSGLEEDLPEELELLEEA